jgi:hypothetical protein
VRTRTFFKALLDVVRDTFARDRGELGVPAEHAQKVSRLLPIGVARPLRIARASYFKVLDGLR